LALIILLFPFFLALKELQNSSYRDCGNVVGFPSGFWGRTPAKIKIRALGPITLKRDLVQQF